MRVQTRRPGPRQIRSRGYDLDLLCVLSLIFATTVHGPRRAILDPCRISIIIAFLLSSHLLPIHIYKHRLAHFDCWRVHSVRQASRYQLQGLLRLDNGLSVSNGRASYIRRIFFGNRMGSIPPIHQIKSRYPLTRTSTTCPASHVSI